MTDEPSDLKSLPVLPLKNSVLFPQQMMPLAIGRPRSVAAVEAALATEDKTVLVVAQKDSTVDEPTDSGDSHSGCPHERCIRKGHNRSSGGRLTTSGERSARPSPPVP